MWNQDRLNQVEMLKQLLDDVQDAACDPKALSRAQSLAEALRAPVSPCRVSFADFVAAQAQAAPIMFVAAESLQHAVGEGAHLGGTLMAYKAMHRVFDQPLYQLPKDSNEQQS